MESSGTSVGRGSMQRGSVITLQKGWAGFLEGVVGPLRRGINIRNILKGRIVVTS